MKSIPDRRTKAPATPESKANHRLPELNCGRFRLSEEERGFCIDHTPAIAFKQSGIRIPSSYCHSRINEATVREFKSLTQVPVAFVAVRHDVHTLNWARLQRSADPAAHIDKVLKKALTIPLRGHSGTASASIRCPMCRFRAARETRST